ncbi:hypothetical protein TH0213_13650 [Helicobacter pylori]
MNEINEQLPQEQEELQELTGKKTTMFTLKFGESLTIEHDCKNLMEIKIQTDKGSKTFYFKLPQPKEENLVSSLVFLNQSGWIDSLFP